MKMPGNTSPSIVLHSDNQVHLLHISATGAPQHYPHADGLAEPVGDHKDTDDGVELVAHLCTTLKKGCGARCTSNRNATCQVTTPDIVNCPGLEVEP